MIESRIQHVNVLVTWLFIFYQQTGYEWYVDVFGARHHSYLLADYVGSAINSHCHTE